MFLTKKGRPVVRVSIFLLFPSNLYFIARLAIVSNAKRGKIKIELPLRTKARILDVSVRS